MNVRDLITARSPAYAGNTTGWADGFARWTIRHAAHRAPPPLSERLEEEWLADLEARSGPVPRLRLGLGCWWAVTVIAYEHRAPKMAAASTTGNKIMTSYVRSDSPLLSKRTPALVLIVGVHALLVYALATGLAPRVVAALPTPLQAYFPEIEKTHPTPPPPTPQPNLTRPVIDVTPPVIDVQVPPDPDAIRPTDIQLPPSHTVEVPPEISPHVVNRVAGGTGKGFPNPDDYYPAAAKRLDETGLSLIRVCVDGRGRLTSAPTLERSSGSQRLDDGAMKLARDGSGHYRPTLEDGRPVESCFPLPIRFRLTN